MRALRQSVNQYIEVKANQDRIRAEQRNLINALKSSQIVTVNKLEQGRAECGVCYSKPATIVYVPCNHLYCCEDCAEIVRRSRNSKCPFCQTEVDYSKTFSLIKIAKKD